MTATEENLMGKTIATVHDENDDCRGKLVVRFTDGSRMEVISDTNGYGGETTLDFYLYTPNGQIVQDVINSALPARSTAP